MVSWSVSDLAETLGVTLGQASDALPVLEMQGYVRQSGKGAWITTIAGEAVSGSVTPRFRKEAVEQALDELKDRIKRMNADRSAQATVTRAVAYGDFLSGRAQEQAADVGIELKARGRGQSQADDQVLTALRAKSPMLRLRPYEDWMGQRTHRKLI